MDAFLFLAVVQSLRRTLVGATVRHVHPAGTHGLWMDFVTGTGQDSLLVVADEHFPRIVPGAGRPAKGGTLSPLAGVARHAMPGTVLQSINHRGLDRILTLEFGAPSPLGDAGYLVIAELFGRRPNLLLVDRPTGRILEAARHSPVAAGRILQPDHPYLPPPRPPRPDPRLLESTEATSAVIAAQLAAGLAPGVVLRQSFAGLTELWVKEVLARTRNPEGAEDLSHTLLNLIRSIESGPWQPHLILDGDGRPIAASPIRLSHVVETRQEPCPTLGEVVERLARYLDRQRIITERQIAFRQLLRRLEVRLGSRRTKLVAESLEFARADLSRRMGEVLVAHQSDVPRGASQVTLPDHAAGPEASITIPLDPTLSPMANAEAFFKAARRARRGAVRVTARLADTEVELARVEAWAGRVAEASDPDTLGIVRKEMEETPRLLAPRDRALLGSSDSETRGHPRHGSAHRAPEGAHGASPGQVRGTGLDPRRFVSSDGLPILVGRNTRSNDYLTLHLARSQDLWLHVQGYSGSHVVVRVPNRSDGAPRRTLVQAAQLAAYYSQARDHGKVAVNYTLRKYVRKPKKAKPGLVTISQEKTIIVTPDKSLVQKLAAQPEAG